jgi:hypothetical protein
MARATKTTALPPCPVEAVTPETVRRDDVVAWLEDLRQRAERGDEAACRQITLAYDEVGLWEKLTGLAESVEFAFLDLIAPKSQGHLFTRKALQRDIARRKAALLGADPSPLERLLVERVVANWLACQQADTLYAYTLAESTPLAKAEYLGRQSERANRQLLRSVKTLATVRRLLKPVVQVNIADQQINVAG